MWVEQPLDLVQDRAQELVQTGKGDLRLTLHPGRRQHPHLPGAGQPHRLRQQRRLTDPRLAAHDDRTTSIAYPFEEATQEPQLGPHDQSAGPST
jgi:hypothetical protein